MPEPKILFVVNSADFFRSHRLPLALAALARGWRAVVACGAGSGESRLQALGVQTLTFPLSRAGFDPRAEWRSYRALLRLYRQEQPDLVHHVTIKPVIYGTCAARVARVPAVVNAVPGLGFVFTAVGLGAWLRRKAVNALYRYAVVHPNMRLIFQNRDDQQGFLANTSIARSSTHLIRGSGVDLAMFVPTSEPTGSITFLLVARMLLDKGIADFVGAARRVRAKHPDWRFRLAGDVDVGNPSSLSPETLRAWQAEGVVEWLGHRRDVPELLAQCHVACLPSHREGLPKSLLEAAAAGRPSIAADVPGCREVVRHDVTGVLVPARDEAALAQAMIRLGENGALRLRMGAATRARAEALYSIEDVVRHTFLVYEALLAR